MKLNKILIGATVLLLGGAGLSSCSDNILSNGMEGDGNVIFSVNLGTSHATRAIGDGTDADRLQYAVYDKDGNLVDNGKVGINNYSAQVALQLVKGQVYDIAFFADRTSYTCYSFEAVKRTVSIDYSKMTGTSSTYRENDCFYKVIKGYQAGSPVPEVVTLTRPMAQVNFGTTAKDFEDYCTLQGKSKSGIYFNISSTAYTKLNLLTGEGEESVEVTTAYKRNAIEASGIGTNSTLGTFPVNGYLYLASMYLLVGDNAELRTVSLNVYDNKNSTDCLQSVSMDNVPLKTNHRTNIYGKLLTEENNFKVEIEPLYDGTKDVWTGNVMDPIDNGDGTYSIYNGAQLAGLAKNVNAGNDYAGKTVYLESDLDLNSRNWTPIGTDEIKAFKGLFDGKGYTISNLKVVNGDNSNPAGLFGFVSDKGSSKGKLFNFTIDGATIKNTASTTPDNGMGTGVVLGSFKNADGVYNVTVKNAVIEARHYAGGIVGAGYGDVINCTSENVVIKLETAINQKDGKIDFADKAGGIIGVQHEGDRYKLNNNVVKNITISGYRHLGGIAGYINYAYNENKREVKDNTVTGGLIMQDFSENYKNLNPGEKVDKLFGEVAAKVTPVNNNATGVEIKLPTTVNSVVELANAISNGGFITLGTNITVPGSGNIDLTEPTFINLNGNSLNLGSNKVIVHDELTIDGAGTVTSSTFTLNGEKGSTIVINDGLIETTTTNENEAAIYSAGNVIINGGTVKSNGHLVEAVRINWAGPDNTESDHYAEINGGVFNAGDEYSFYIYGGSSTGKNTVVINGGEYVGCSGARADGNVDVVINDGIFIQTNNSTGHGFCAGAGYYSEKCNVTINGGYFYGTNGYSICCAGNAKLTVNKAIVNKTQGGFTLGLNSNVSALTPAVVKTIKGVDYTFGYQIK